MAGLFSEESTNGLEVSELAKSYIRETARWAKFLAIMGFILAGILTLSLISMLASPPGAEINPYVATFGKAGNVFVIFVLGLAILVLLYPGITLYKFASSSQNACLTNDSIQLDNAFKNLKRTFRFVGIYTIFMLFVYGIAIILLLTIAVTASV